jgi:glutaredoxin
MKQLIVLRGTHCAYCKKAKMLIRRALEKAPEFAALDIRYICDESPEGAAYSHMLVPAFFCGGAHEFEGNPDMATVVSILRKCYES